MWDPGSISSILRHCTVRPPGAWHMGFAGAQSYGYGDQLCADCLWSTFPPTRLVQLYSTCHRHACAILGHVANTNNKLLTVCSPSSIRQVIQPHHKRNDGPCTCKPLQICCAQLWVVWVVLEAVGPGLIRGLMACLKCIQPEALDLVKGDGTQQPGTCMSASARLVVLNGAPVEGRAVSWQLCVLQVYGRHLKPDSWVCAGRHGRLFASAYSKGTTPT